MSTAEHGAALPASWIAGSALERVARRLRLLGFDVEPGGAARLDGLVARARASGRGVLTTSVRRLPRASGVWVLTLPADAVAAVRQVAAIAAPASAPFRRCTLCNLELVTVDAPAEDRAVPADVRAARHVVRRCPACGRRYWPGSHTDRLRRWLETALGRPVAGPEEVLG